MPVPMQAIQAAGLAQVRAGAYKRGKVLMPEREAGVRGAGDGVMRSSGGTISFTRQRTRRENEGVF